MEKKSTKRMVHIQAKTAPFQNASDTGKSTSDLTQSDYHYNNTEMLQQDDTFSIASCLTAERGTQ